MIQLTFTAIVKALINHSKHGPCGFLALSSAGHFPPQQLFS